MALERKQSEKFLPRTASIETRGGANEVRRVGGGLPGLGKRRDRGRGSDLLLEWLAPIEFSSIYGRRYRLKGSPPLLTRSAKVIE